MILVNDSLPGPTIRAREGDTVVVRLRNALREGTTIHWHGVRVPNAPFTPERVLAALARRANP